MACRAALVAVLPSACSAISSLHTSSSRSARRVLIGDVSLLDRESIEDELMPVAGDDCKQAEEGTDCYKSVTWLRQEGLSDHPEWYQGYSSESTFGEVQDMLYGLGKANCPKPCLGPGPIALFKSGPKFDCRDAIKGDACYASVSFLKEVGLELHPDWFPELRADSSTSSIQAELHRRGKADCPLPCSLTDEDKAYALREMKGTQRDNEFCNDAQPGTQCYNDVTYGMAEGIKNYPFMYEGLTEASTFRQVQEHMYLHRRSFCGKPCPENPLDLELVAKHPEEFREKKRVQDMSMKELNDYFNGDWDGVQVSLYKKSQHGASTTITPEEALAPMVGDDGNARPEEMEQRVRRELEQRIQKELLDETQQRTPVAPELETEEAMRQRLRAELAREEAHGELQRMGRV